jgi:TolB-like protein/DNA-binding winged helix-turn-helix (wHTH) protein/Flp pilus assembly protein TadD
MLMISEVTDPRGVPAGSHMRGGFQESGIYFGVRGSMQGTDQPSPGPTSPAQSSMVRFGVYEFDRLAGELRKQGMRIRLEGQPLAILKMLLEHRGEVVSREELQKKLWPADTFVDFEHSLNAAVKRLRTALNDSPDEPRYIETLARRGYRFIAPVEVGAAQAPEKIAAEERSLPLISTPAVAPARFRAGRVWLIALVLVFVAGTGAWGWLQWRNRAKASVSGPVIRSLAVLPLDNLSAEPSQQYLADGMTEDLIGRLSMIHGLRVISRTSVMHFKNTQLSVPEIGKALNVDALVEGSVIRDGDRVRVHAQLIRAATDEHFWSEEYDRELKDVLTLQSDMAEAIAKRVEVSVTGQERALLVAARPVAPEVYESYVKAKSDPENTKVHIEQRIADFQDAIRKDPTFAPAYVGLAETYISYQDIFVGAPPSEIRPKAISAARKALELDPELAEGHAILAEMYQKQWKWAESEAEYKRALELKPNDASAHRGYAYWLACQGRTEEALAWVKRGRELDPLGSADTIPFLLLVGRRYDESIREYRSVLAVHPDSNARWGLGFALIVNNQTSQAIPELERTVAMMTRSPGSLEMLATAYGRAGNRAEALRLIDELKQRRQKSYVPAGAFIKPHLALGDYDQAFFWCEEAYKEQSAILQWIKVDPFFDPVRGDPRFTDLVHRIGLDKSY